MSGLAGILATGCTNEYTLTHDRHMVQKKTNKPWLRPMQGCRTSPPWVAPSSVTAMNMNSHTCPTPPVSWECHSDASTQSLLQCSALLSTEYVLVLYSQIQVDLDSRFICYEDNSIADQREDFGSKVDQRFFSKITRGKEVDNLYIEKNKMNNHEKFCWSKSTLWDFCWSEGLSKR